MKVCTKCKNEKALTEFNRRTVASDGLTSSCRDCDKADRAARRDQMRAYSAAHYLANKEKRAEQVKAWQQANWDKVLTASRKWTAANHDKVAAANAAFRAANPDYHRDWAKANPEKVRASQMAYQQANPEKFRDKAKRRRAAKRGAWTEKVELAVLVERDGGYCGICHKPVKAAERSIDHVLPLSKGGAHSYANTRLAHLRCNTSRGNRGAAQLRLVG